MITHPRQSVQLEVEGEPVHGELVVPENPTGIVVFAAGMAGARHATLESRLAGHLNDLRIATLVMDLLSHHEAADRSVRSDVDLLTQRLRALVDWLDRQEETASLGVGVCAADTGAAAAVQFVTDSGRDVAGLTVINGRLDLASSALSDLQCPILFFLEETHGHLESTNRTAYERADLPSQHKHFLHVADHDALSLVARWFGARLQKPPEPPPKPQ